MIEPFTLPFVQRAMAEVLLLSIAAGVLGTWIVLRGLAFYSHAVGTAAFPGLVLAGGLGFSAPLGAFAVAVLFAGGMQRLSKDDQDDSDSRTALLLVAALVVGVILASNVFHSGSNIETLLFGSLLVTGPGDMALAAVASLLVLGGTLTLGRRWLAQGFDAAGARALGVRTRWPESALLLLIALAVTAALASTGALLATALFVIPAATVRLWTRRVAPWQVATVILVVVEGTMGLWLSVRTNAPPGATIAALAGGVFALGAAARGLVARTRRAPRPGRPLAAATLLTAAIALVAAACGAAAGTTSGSGDSLDVVATTTQIGDWVRTVGGDAVMVTQILQPNSDPHDYEPRPSDVEAVAKASLVFENGDNLDAWMGKVIDDAGGSPTVVDLGAGVPDRIPGETSGPEASRFDPHWWHDPANVEEAVTRIADALSTARPAAKPTYRANAAAYIARLRALDAGIAACFGRIPRDQRKLVTDHDAFNYFAKRYGITVIGAVIPSQTTQAEPSARALADLATLIEREGVKAIFPESSLSPKLAQAIARETGASAAYTLYGDTLGPAGSPGATYLTMEAANADAMVRGFTAGAQTCTIAGIG